MTKLIYLASPYTAYEHGRDRAFVEVSLLASRLMDAGVNVFCPIAHSHSIEELAMQFGDWDKRGSGPFWLKQDFAVLQHCDELWVYKMPGWDTSYGVGKEIEFANNNNIRIKYIEYEAVRTDRETATT